PEGADILVNGIFEGTTPATLDLSSTVHEIEVRLRGYAPWRRRVNIEKVHRIEVNLNPKAVGRR
ncbi:MAG: PEGA domain-containing protein, partial [bacterium]|nr:PEGA domain-containing protein [bacterium]